MRTFVHGALGLAIVLGLLAPAEADARRMRARPDRMVMGPEAQERVEHLIGDLKWETSLDAAKRRAAAEGKLVFWVHMLGKIDGST